MVTIFFVILTLTFLVLRNCSYPPNKRDCCEYQYTSHQQSLKKSMGKLPKFHKCTSQQVGIVIGNEDVGSVKVSKRTSLAQVRKSNRAGKQLRMMCSIFNVLSLNTWHYEKKI